MMREREYFSLTARTRDAQRRNRVSCLGRGAISEQDFAVGQFYLSLP
jgi:hypothetical protein